MPQYRKSSLGHKKPKRQEMENLLQSSYQKLKTAKLQLGSTEAATLTPGNSTIITSRVILNYLHNFHCLLMAISPKLGNQAQLKASSISLPSALYVPKCPFSLMSGSQLTKILELFNGRFTFIVCVSGSQDKEDDS